MPSPSIRKPVGIIRRTERGTLLVAALVGAVLAVFTGYAALFRPGESLVSLSYDMPFIVHRPGSADMLRIVYLKTLDEELLDRRPQAAILDKLGEAGARAVVYDVIFDRESKDPAIDLKFAAAIRRFRGVDQDGKPIPGAPQRHVFLACGRKTFKVTGATGKQLIPPNDVLLTAADDFGLVACDDDDAFIIRKLSTGSRGEPSLIWKTAKSLGADLDDKGRLQLRWLNFAGPPRDPEDKGTAGAIRSCGADSVLLGGMSTAFFHDKVVVIGGEPGIVGMALGKDLFSTPFHRFQIGRKLALMSGVEIQANGLANLLQGNWLNRSSREFDLGLIVAAGILMGAGFTLISPVRAIIAAVVLTHVAGLAGILTMHYQNYWFPWSVVSFLQVPVALGWGIAARYYVERFFRIRLTAEQEAILAAFEKYTSPQMLKRMKAEGFDTSLAGEKIEAAMMFTDLEAFTDMCERVHEPQRIVMTLKDYFERTTGSIFEHDGVIIKYIGDSIFAAWGAPLADPDAPVKAVRAAWDLFERGKLVVEGVDLRTRIGLHFGEVVAGNIGSTRRVDYTLIGDAVNLASRLEGINKLFDACILMSEAIHSRLDGEFRTRRVGKFRVRGRKEITTVYELLGPAIEEHEPEWIGEYHRALAALEQNDTTTAHELFSSVNRNRGPHGDGPSRFFIERINSNEPIPDGVIIRTEK